MRLARADGALTVAAAAVTALVLGAGSPLLDADGTETLEGLQVTPEGRPIASICGCEVTARQGADAAGGKGETVLILSARNPGSAPAEIEIAIAVERREMRPEAAMRRVISADDMIVTEVARELARISVPPGKTAERPVKLDLPAGEYSVSARRTTEPDVALPLCSLSVPAATASGEEGRES